jgi:hypothetical protein
MFSRPKGETPVSAAELVAFYNAARAEILERIKLRDQCILAYIASTAVILGVMFKSDGLEGLYDVKLIGSVLIPLVCLIFTIVISSHHVAIGNIGQYIVAELYPTSTPPHWDISATRFDKGSAQWPRASSQMLILSLPMLCTIWFLCRSWPATVDDANARALVVALVCLNLGMLVWCSVINVAAYTGRLSAERKRELSRPGGPGKA